MPFQLELGVKSDPIQYRYSFDWLFRLMAEEGVRNLQLGTFFEIYRLPDRYFVDLRRTAESYGVAIRSVFTSHRELGGFFQLDPAYNDVALASYRRLIEIGRLVGASSVGCNPGAVLRDQKGTKDDGSRRYLDAMKALMVFAYSEGVEWLTMEPMSCLAEPPTTPDEIEAFATELCDTHCRQPATANIGFCADVSHGYADSGRQVIHDNMRLLEAALPWTYELHLRNTDAVYGSTLGFSEAEMERGIVDPSEIRDFYLQRAYRLPVDTLVGYLEIPGPKLGRDYSDGGLDGMLRGSLRTLTERWLADWSREPIETGVKLAPSIMCADQGNLETEVRRLEQIGVDMIHVDVMDAHFVPNMPIGLETIRILRKLTSLPLDVHLMVEDNAFFVDKLAAIGVDRICVHAETAVHLTRILRAIKAGGMEAGVALCPATPLSVLDYVKDEMDFLLLMTVDPGFAGQPLVQGVLRKIADARKLLSKRRTPIEVDGNVSFVNIPRMVQNGADELVLGSSSLFHPDDSISRNVTKIRQLIREVLTR